jgi:hypothetical protein
MTEHPVLAFAPAEDDAPELAKDDPDDPAAATDPEEDPNDMPDEPDPDDPVEPDPAPAEPDDEAPEVEPPPVGPELPPPHAATTQPTKAKPIQRRIIFDENISRSLKRLSYIDGERLRKGASDCVLEQGQFPMLDDARRGSNSEPRGMANEPACSACSGASLDRLCAAETRRARRRASGARPSFPEYPYSIRLVALRAPHEPQKAPSAALR